MPDAVAPNGMPAPSVRSPAAELTKRALDVSVASVIGLCTMPVQAAAAVAILIEDGRPVFFVQERAGMNGTTFRVAKFRSMKVNEQDPMTMGRVGLDHELVTRTGRVIRRLKIDELPQLWNVVKGEMSLVGPRPPLPEQAKAYDRFERRRLLVRPGLAGWAQVNGNVSLDWSSRIMLDVWYVDHWSLLLDLRILLRTLIVVLAGERPRLQHLEEARAYADSVDWRG